MRKIRRTFVLGTICTMMILGLTGCFKGNVSVDLKSNGSGIVTVQIGMTQQAQALVASQGTNLFGKIENSMADASGKIPEGVEVKKWSDGDYNWISASKNFSNLEQINQVLGNKTLFNRFSLTRKRGIFQDEFTLDAELSALTKDMPSSDSGIDPSAFIQMDFSARLPGKIVETNGFPDGSDPNHIVWTATGYETVPITARSTAWNWLNISGIAAILFMLAVFGAYALGGLDFILYPSKKNMEYLPQTQYSVQSSEQRSHYTRDYIVELGVEDLLNQVNTRGLHSIGEIHRQPGEIALVWKDAQGVQRFLDVKDMGNHQIAVNGQNYLATRDNVKAGIMHVLQKPKPISSRN